MALKNFETFCASAKQTLCMLGFSELLLPASGVTAFAKGTTVFDLFQRHKICGYGILDIQMKSNRVGFYNILDSLEVRISSVYKRI